MADRTCAKCGKAFAKPTQLRRHQARKTPCAPIIEPEDLPAEALEDPVAEQQKKCRFCGRVFSSYTSMRRHVRNTCKIAPNEKNGDTGMEVLYEHTIRRQEARIATLERQNAEMLGMMREMRGMVLGGGQNAGEVAIAGDANQVDNRKQVIVNVFGKEGLDHVTIARIKAILDESMRAPALPEAANAAVLKTALLVYSDPDHPENLTAYPVAEQQEDERRPGPRVPERDNGLGGP